MSEERLRQLYSAAVAGHSSAEGHPAPEAIAALARREGSEADRLATLDHVMGCGQCRRDFDLVRTVQRAGVESGVVSSGARRSWFVPVALAASLLLAVGIGREALRMRSDDITRGRVTGSVTLVRPGADAAAGEPLAFAWRPVPGAQRYHFELLDAGGNVVASAATGDTAAAPLAVRTLPPGEYRWWVRATTSDARVLRSALRPLRLSTP